jgi:hypothetical protein
LCFGSPSDTILLGLFLKTFPKENHMPDEFATGPIIDFDCEPTREQQVATLAQLRKAMRPPGLAPATALNLLFESANRDTGGSQVVRSFLFWLAGLPDPTGFQGSGGLELRRLDLAHKEAALEILAWWAGPTESDEVLYQLLKALTDRFRVPP